MAKLLMIAGALVGVLGIVLIPLPGPGFPFLTLGTIALLVGAVLHVIRARGQRPTS